MYQVGEIVVVENPYVKNQVGGTSQLIGKVKAKIVEAWEDYEIGSRYIGKLFEEEDINKSKEAGKSSFTPEDYKKYGEKMYQETKESFENWDPTKVYFGQFDNIEKGA